MEGLFVGGCDAAAESAARGEAGGFGARERTRRSHHAIARQQQVLLAAATGVGPLKASARRGEAAARLFLRSALVAQLAKILARRLAQAARIAAPVARERLRGRLSVGSRS